MADNNKIKIPKGKDIISRLETYLTESDPGIKERIMSGAELKRNFSTGNRQWPLAFYNKPGFRKEGYLCLVESVRGNLRLKDFIKLEGEGEFLRLDAGTFVILAPQDAHMPGMAVDEPAPVKKVVVKVLI